MIAVCRYSDCIKSNECLRFLEKEGCEVFFKDICGESNNYKWFWKAEQKVVVKEEVKENV